MTLSVQAERVIVLREEVIVKREEESGLLVGVGALDDPSAEI